MPGIVFVFLALFTSIFSTVIKKPILKKGGQHDAIAYAMIAALLGGLFASLFYFFTSFRVSDFSAFGNPTFDVLLFLDILCWALGSFLFYPAYKHLPVSESTVITTLQGVFALVVGLAIFKTESFNILHLLGGGLILVSVFTVNQAKGWKLDIQTLLLIAATAIFGIAIVLDNMLIAHQYFSSPLFLEVWNFGLVGVLMILVYPKKLPHFPTILTHKRAFFTVVTNTLSTLLSFFLVYLAYSKGIVASQANLILSSQTVIVVMLGVVLFKEKGSFKKRLFGALIATVGVYLLS